MDSNFDTIMEQVISDGASEIQSVFVSLLNLGMKLERSRFLGAEPYARGPQRNGHANGFKSKRVDTKFGTLEVAVPKTRGSDEPFYPSSLERGSRCGRAFKLCIAQMYISGVSTRRVEKVMKEFGIDSISSSEVSRCVALLDPQLEAWRQRPLSEAQGSEYRYLMLDARYEKVRMDGVVRDGAVLSAIGIAADGRRRVLGVSVSLSEAQTHWQEFLQSLVNRGLAPGNIKYIVSDAHSGLSAARKAVFGNAMWQRCQFHLSKNALHYAPTKGIKEALGAQLRNIYTAPDLKTANKNLRALVDKYAEKHPSLAEWLEQNIPEGLTVFGLPDDHHKRMRTSNAIERCGHFIR